jgi:hypothetical protein
LSECENAAMNEKKRGQSPSQRASAGPVLVDQFFDNGLGLRPYCACGRNSVLMPADLECFPRGTMIETIKARLVCKACGAIGVTTAQVVSVAALGAYPRG